MKKIPQSRENESNETFSCTSETRTGFHYRPSTATLDKELKLAKNLDSFLDDNKSCMQTKTLYDHLNMLLMKKNLRVSDVIEPSGIEKPYVYQIFSGQKKPSRDKLIAIAFGLGLTADETDTLLKVAHYKELYVKDKRDLIIKFCLLQGYNLKKTNEILFDYELAAVGHLK